jgi:23S rRNA pseudouridine955/2504/2580 synthase
LAKPSLIGRTPVFPMVSIFRMKGLSKDSASWLVLGDEAEGQRIDNYLLRTLKGVPKSHVYRILRSGEIRVNSRRAAPMLRLHAGDRVRLPPIRVAETAPRPEEVRRPIDLPVLFEDADLLVVDKPAGLAVHGGSGVSEGLIEILRRQRPELRFLELVHRLDKGTSGVLLLAKKRSALTELHRQIRAGETDKRYLTLVRGRWRGGRQQVRLSLLRHLLSTGERHVVVSEAGKASVTGFAPRNCWDGASLIEADLRTGRTHQIRVHLAHLGYPIAGDDKYGDFAWNRELARLGLKRMFLHAARFGCHHPGTGERVAFESPLPPGLATVADWFRRGSPNAGEGG